MERTVIESSAAPRAIGPYSQAIRVGNLVFSSGQIPLSPLTGEMVGGSDIRAQTKQVMDNLAAVLKAAGVGLADVAKATIFVTDLANFAAVNEVYGSYFSGVAPPARSTVQVAALPRGAGVEIEAIAIVR